MTKSSGRKNKEKSIHRVFHYFWLALMQVKIRTALELILIPLDVFIDTYIISKGSSELLAKLSTGDFDFNSYIPILLFIIVPILFKNLILIRIIDWLDWTMDAKGGRYLSNLAFNAIINQSMSFHNDHFSGSLTSQANKLSSAFIDLKSNTIWDLYPLVLSVLISIISIWFISPAFAILLLLVVIIYSVVCIVTFLKTRHIDETWSTAENKQTGQLADSITNALSVKSYARERFEKRRFDITTKNTEEAIYKVAKVSMWRNFSLNFVIEVAYVALLILVVAGHNLFGLSVASTVFVYSMSTRIISQIWNLNHILRTFNRSLGNAKEMVEILDLPYIVDDKTDVPLKIEEASVDFYHISFKHDGQKTALFNDFSLKINSGERVGLVGVSGSGKTTLTKLLLRFADVNSGMISVSGKDIRDVTQASLRENIAYVPQESSLFHRSIKENIAYGKPDATDKKIIAAAKLAHADEFINTLPDKYETLVGERGVKLSGGQRQRIAIARAILKDAPILVLDEATSALDSESEASIQAALNNLMENRTSIVIAHRLSTVANLDRIIVLKDGKIIEEGTHQGLLKKQGEYSKLWSHQSGAFINDNK